jgi:hypothetical protein
MGLLVDPVIALIQLMRKRRRSGWTVGVVRAPTAWKGEKVMFRETVDDEAAIVPRVRELAAQIERGAIPGD